MSSLIFLGFSIIMFFTTFGIMFLLMPMIMGAFFTLADDFVPSIDSDWQAVYAKNEETARYLTPLVPTIAIFVAGIKIFMVASARGRD